MYAKAVTSSFYIKPVHLIHSKKKIPVVVVDILIPHAFVGKKITLRYFSYSTCSSGKGKNLGYYEGARPLIPAFILFVLFVTWAFNSSINIAGRDPRLFYFCSGTVFSNITVRIKNFECHIPC